MAELVVALDLPSREDALRLVDRLPGLGWAKVGPMLFLESGPTLIGELKRRGIKVFLDLKWHDIPNSVQGAVRAAAALGVDLATVHTLGGREMMAAAAAAAGAMRLVGVSVLTSHSAESYWEAVGRERGNGLEPEVARLAGAAIAAGLGGVVASPLEIPIVRPVVGPERWIVVPGIRAAGSSTGDQQRTLDARSAARAGATHLVVGRPITEAPNPGAAYRNLIQEIA